MAIKVNNITVIGDDLNVSNVGVVTATSFSGSAAGLTNVPAPVAGEVEAVASGNLYDGTKVVVNSDGTVSATYPFGPETIFDNFDTFYSNIAYDSTNGKVIYAYRQGGSGPGMCVIGEVSGDTISFGTPVQFATSGGDRIVPIYDSSTDRVVVQDDNKNGLHGFQANSGAVFVGTISGNSISFGSPVKIVPGTTSALIRSFGGGNGAPGTIISTYQISGQTSVAVVGTITGGATNTVSFGTTATYTTDTAESGGNNIITPTYFDDSGTDRIIIPYQNRSSGDRGTAVVGTQSGNSLTFGTPVQFESANAYELKSVIDTNENRVVTTYKRSTTSGAANAIVGQVSGNSISFGTRTEYNPSANSMALAYNPVANRIIVGYSDLFNEPGNVKVGTVTGGATNSITFGPELSEYTPNAVYTRAVYDSINDTVVFIYSDYANDYIAGRTFNTLSIGSLSETNFVGISKSSYTDGQTATIQIAGSVDDAQTGLTTGSKYYVQTNGTLSTTPDIPSVLAGTAIASNKIIVKQ